jgi:hypothetical protein
VADQLRMKQWGMDVSIKRIGVVETENNLDGGVA